MTSRTTKDGIDGERLGAFIAHWSGREGGQERANYGLFLIGFCDVLGLPRPEPAGATSETNDYVFERVVKDTDRAGTITSKRIDLYKRGCFVLEAKQSRIPGGKKELFGQAGVGIEVGSADGRRGPARAWDVLMMHAHRQAETYVRLLPLGHEPPPIVLVCDVGHCFEVYANFRRDGKAYDQFPDRQSFRVYLEDLRDPAIRDRLRRIWTDPAGLDPARVAARVTRAIAERLAAVSKALEARGLPTEEVAGFLTRCLFTMFAEDVGLLPEAAFKRVLERCEAEPAKFVPMVSQLWEAMDKGEFAFAIESRVRHFNGEFFRARKVFALGREEIGELRRAASYDWRDVDPSIFGTLLEQALDPDERRRLGAHYTPRAYVERLVVAAVIEPLRANWDNERSTADKLHAEGRASEAARIVARFHDKLCATRILDPACGTANFLYVTLELLKRLEGDVLEKLTALGGQEALSGLEGHTVDPQQFLGLEINPRAKSIADLVLWIGYLRWHLRTRGGLPNEPILRDYKNVQRRDAVLDAEKSLARDARGKPIARVGSKGVAVETYAYANPRRPEWPAAEFIVGNPPFIGGKDLRARLGDGYAEALWAANGDMNESADFVMHWWDRAAELLTRKGTVLRRFGFVTTNSISQVFQRRVVERHLGAKTPVSIVAAIADHPWTKASADAAAVRIAMTVCEAGAKEGVLYEVTREDGLDTDTPLIEFAERAGRINADLTVGVDVTKAARLLANEGLCSPGMKLHGAGFIVTPAQAAHLGRGRQPDLDRHIKPYRNGRDLTGRPRGVMVIDLFGLDADAVRHRYPAVYQHLLATVKPERDKEAVRSGGKDAEAYARLWWLFGKPRQQLRPALEKLSRYIATVETAKHRVFQFLDASVVPDNMLVAMGSDDAFHLGILSSRVHTTWALRAGGWLGLGNDPRYSKSRCFDPFPFPAADEGQKHLIRAIAEELDTHRKKVLAEHPHLTLTGLYNVLAKVRAGEAATGRSGLTPEERRVFDDGLVLIVRELHDALDAEVAAAYGWPAGLAEEEVLARLVALNVERAGEEKAGVVRWLRPELQIPRFGGTIAKAELELAGGGMRAVSSAMAGTAKQSYPNDDSAQTAVVVRALALATTPLDAPAIAAGFRQGRRVTPRIEAVLASLYRMGIVDTADRGASFSLRRAA